MSSSRSHTWRNSHEANNENEFESQLNPIPLPPLRTPLNTIPDPSQNPKEIQDNDLEFKARVQGNRSIHKKVETLSHGTPNRPGSVRGKLHLETKSANSTPARSVSNSGASGACTGNRPSREIGTRGGNCSRVLKGFSIAPPSDPSTEVPYFELVEDPSFWTDHNVQVLIRMRPISSIERALQGTVRCLKQENAQTLSWLGHPETRFTFDHIACEMISQEKLFKVAGLPMVENCMSGYNSCMFAYGQTGSGKTYTMMGDIYEVDGKLSEDCGVTPRIFEYLFMKISDEEEHRRDENLRYSCKCSFLEIYNEQITDLLEPSSSNLQLREDMGKGVYVENLTEHEVTTVRDVLQLLLKGAANRKMAATNMNRESSRSHSVFTCVIESRRDIDSVTHLRFGRLNLVDLAGSERQKSSGAEGERLKEAANINKSLSTLGLVIMNLVDVAHGKHRHVPYRDSRLTFLLQDSLGGNSKTTIIANISPSICSANETLSTLKFAQRAKLIQNNAKVNEDAPGDVAALQRQIQKLKDQLAFLLKHQNISKSPTICWTNVEHSQSCDMDEIYDSSLERKISDHHKDRIFSKEKMRCIEAILAGALRREKMADASVKRLEADIEHMNRLVHQGQEDAQCTKMILRLREERIERLEFLSDGFISADEFLMEENKTLLEEIQLLQARIDRNPELTRFALENIRLIEQLRMFQDFYEQGERETLLAEITELRDQLMEKVQGNNGQLNSFSGTVNQEQDKVSMSELEDCKRNLAACIDINAKLTMEVDQLRRELSTYTDCERADTVLDSLSDESVTVQQTERKSSVKIKSVRNESDDEIASYNQNDAIFHVKNGQQIDDALAMEVNDPPKELMDTKSLIEAMEYEQLRLIEQVGNLQTENLQYADLLEKKSYEERKFWLKPETSYCGQQSQVVEPFRRCVDGGDITWSPFTAKLEGLNRDLEEVRVLNKSYLDHQASQLFQQTEFEQVCEQAEAETAKTILHLQEEITELQEKMNSMTEENSRLRNAVEDKDNEIKVLSEEWEKATLELTSFLLDGYRSLEDASDQIGNIAASFPEKKACICEHIERAAYSYLEKERTIVKLRKNLEEAQKLGLEMELKLHSLKGATLVITEIQQLENTQNSREVTQLQMLLGEKIAKIEELEKKLKYEEDQVIEAHNHANDARQRCFQIPSISDLNVNSQEGFRQLAAQTFATQLQSSDLRLVDAEAGCSNTREVRHPDHNNVLSVGNEKIKIAASFFSKFEEAQATVKEADAMLNELLKANKTAKHVTDRWKQAGEELMVERAGLIEEVLQLKSSISMKEGEYDSVQAQVHSSLADIALSVSSLEESFQQMQSDVEESFNVIYAEILSLGQDLRGFICRSRSSLEDIWTDIMKNGFAIFVLYQCYTGNLSKEISNIKLDPNSFRHRQKSCCSVVHNVGEGCTRDGSLLVKAAQCTEEYQIEHQQYKLGNLGHTLEFKPFDMVSTSDEGKSGLNPVNLLSENLSLKKELTRKDELLKGLLFDISLLQESTSSSKDTKDETKQIFAALTMVRHELEVKKSQLDELMLQHRRLEAQVVDSEAALSISNSKLEQANETVDMLSKENSDLIVMLDNLHLKMTTVEEQLEEQKEISKALEKEFLSIASSVEEKTFSSLQDIEDELRKVTSERDHLREEVVSLNDSLETAYALADENEAIAVEARQESEASKVYAEQKEEEVKILEHSIEELECTINVLEKKVNDMDAEVERHHRMRDNLEVELQALRLRMMAVENSTDNLDSECSEFGQKEYQMSRLLIERTHELEESNKQIKILEKERADQASEIKECKEYITELVLHAEAQASQYQQKYKTLEAMVHEVKTDPSTSTFAPPTSDRTEKISMRSRGSGSPFRCISSIVQQMKLEKDQEMSAAMLKIEELEALVSSRQKEVCMLSARLAAAENMTHDVIRDLLGVKLDMTNYANFIDQHQVLKLLEETQQRTEESIAKDQEILKLRKKINDLTVERQSFIEDIYQKEADILTAEVTLEQLKQREQMLTAKNEILKMDKINLKRKMGEMDEIWKEHYGQHKFQQQSQQPAKMKETSLSMSGNEELRERLRNSDKLLSCVNDKRAWYSKADSRDRQEQWSRKSRQEPGDNLRAE